MKPVQNGSVWPRIALLLALFLIPVLCVATAFAFNLQITSPYFTLSFGSPVAAVGSTTGGPQTGGPNLVQPQDPQPPNSNPPNTPTTPTTPTTPISTGNGCLLGILCLNADAGVGSASVINLRLGKSDEVAAGASGQCLLGVLCISSLGLTGSGTSGATGPAATGAGNQDCGAVACVDAGLDIATGTEVLSVGVGAEVPLIDTGANVGVEVGQNGINVDVDASLLGTGNENSDEGLQINLLNTLQVGLGGSGGVNVGLNLPSLFP